MAVTSPSLIITVTNQGGSNISLSPNPFIASGTTSLTITGSGFKANATINFWFNASEGAATATTSSSGAFTQVFTYPGGGLFDSIVMNYYSTGGIITIKASDGTNTATSSLTVTGTGAVSPAISIAPTTYTGASLILINGTGFTHGGTVQFQILIQGIVQLYANSTASSTGTINFDASITPAQATSLSAYSTVLAAVKDLTENEYSNTVSLTFYSGYGLTLSSNGGAGMYIASVVGAGANATVSIYVNNAIYPYAGTITADAQGNAAFGLDLYEVNAAGGEFSIYAVANGITSNTINENVPGITPTINLNTDLTWSTSATLYPPLYMCVSATESFATFAAISTLQSNTSNTAYYDMPNWKTVLSNGLSPAANAVSLSSGSKQVTSVWVGNGTYYFMIIGNYTSSGGQLITTISNVVAIALTS